MKNRENELREEILSEDSHKAITAAIELSQDVLSVSGRYEEAEIVLLEVLGRQNSNDGNVIHLHLGELYIKLNELPRSKRFLNIASASVDEMIKKRASELMINTFI